MQLRFLPLLWAVLWAVPAPAWAQIDILSGKSFKQPGGASRDAGANDPKVTIRAVILPADDVHQARLAITAQIAHGWHIYSLTQPAGGPIRTRIKLDSSNAFRVGDFSVDPAPEKHTYPDIWPGLTVEEHTGEVTWQAPLEVAPGVDLHKLKISGAVNAQACAQSCLAPQDYRFTAVPSADDARPIGKPAETATKTLPAATPPVAGAQPGERQPAPEYFATDRYQHGHLTLHGVIEPSAVTPGGKAHLLLTAEPERPYHVYVLADRDTEVGSKPTLIEITSDAGLHFSRPAANIRPVSDSAATPGEAALDYYPRTVSWTIDIAVPADAQPGEYELTGAIGFQTCKTGACDLPSAARFAGKLRIGPTPALAPAKLVFTPAKYAEVAQLAAARPPLLDQHFEIADTGTKVAGLPLMILFSLLGGLILNLMPCVLPVIGLKVLAFVEQAGQSRSRVVLLNLWYTAGMLLVFMVLATLAVTLNLGWGQQFSSTRFNIVMASIVFAMALSFLGFWEIPIPGFVGSGTAAHMAAREGAIGAFAKGVFTTVLATPCSGPFLGSVFGFTLKQPPYVTYLIFASIGLGMASPYLLISAFPRLMRFLPKPGAWMETFKQLMAFMLLGTVVFMFSFMDRDYLVPTFALLIGIWAACWWIGRTPLTYDFRRKALAWLEGAAFAAVVGSFAFTWLVPHESLLEWRPFSQPTLAQLTAEGKTVMVDFTAEWCFNCKLNMLRAIDTKGVRQLVDANRVVPLLADWTDGSEEIREMLSALDSKSIPVLAIFPADNPRHPIVLRDVISKAELIEALKEAGPSRDIKQAVVGANELDSGGHRFTVARRQAGR